LQGLSRALFVTIIIVTVMFDGPATLVRMVSRQR
jgi:hypothetical protein